MLKGGLRDLYTVDKDKWKDPTIRTCGPSTTVKNIDINKDIKEPLTQMYKHWQDDVNRKHLKRQSSYDSTDCVDAQKLSNDIRESLREINYKEIDYILIANKVPPLYRGTSKLAFLQSVPWLAVFDLFDPNSKKDGLYYICNETSDSPRAAIKELGDFKSLKPNEDIQTCGTTWIFRSQSMHESDWTQNSHDCVYRALSAYHVQSLTGHIHCVFLGLSEEYLPEMAEIIKSCFSIIGTKANKCISIISEKTEIGNGIVNLLIEGVRRQVKPPCSIFGLPLDLLRDNVNDMLGPIQFEEPGATTDLPYLNGKPRAVMNKRLNSLTDLEVYAPSPKLGQTVKVIDKARDSFYMGNPIKQLNLFHEHDIRRTLEAKLTARIDEYLKRSTDPSETTRVVETVPLSYESGSGATTLCRRILWEKRSKYRCAVVKAIRPNTDYQIDELQSFLYETNDVSFIPPVLVLVDNFPEYQVRDLQDKLCRRETNCVLLITVPIAKLARDKYDRLAELGQLDENEIEKVKRVLTDVKDKDDKRKEAAANVLKREKRFIWLGLELFGRQYVSIEQRLSQHINNITSQNLTDKLKDAYEMILRFCCLLDFYSKGRSIYPHPCITDILNARGGLDTNCAKQKESQIDNIHDKFGGLLLEDTSESEGYRGWRPAHFLVGEVVRKEIDLLATAKELVTEMNTGDSHARKFLINDTVNIFLQREKISDGAEGDFNESFFIADSSCEDDEFGSPEVQTRYSALIIGIMSLNPEMKDVLNALDLLIFLNEKLTTTEHKARTWQQIARVFAYEIGIKKIPDEASALVSRIYKQVCPGSITNKSPINGFDIAHLGIDEAIKVQDSFVHHVHNLVTKGVFFRAKLQHLQKDASDCASGTEELKTFIQEAIETYKKAIHAYDAALNKTHPEPNLHAMVEKIRTVIVLLEILKCLPFFAQHNDGPDESFKDYMTSGIPPEYLKMTLSQDDLHFFASLGKMAIKLLNDFFREIKIRRTQSYKERERMQDLRNAKIRALKLRKRFYEVTRLDRTHLKDENGYKEEFVQDLLYQYDETTYSEWTQLETSAIERIYEALKKAIPRETASHDAMLIYARAALQMKVKVDELSDHIELWCRKFPRSEWANIFKCMVHFPVPNGSLKADVTAVKSSVAMCKSNSHSQRRYRKSGAEYFLGKGVGLHAIIPSHKVSPNSMEDKTDFWRSKDVYEKLERLKGQKILDRRGVLIYKGIEIMFNNERYPKESRDDLWFCLGFTLNGPYAYDPIGEDKYREIKKSNSLPERKKKESTQPPTSPHDSSFRTPSEKSRAKRGFKRDDLAASRPNPWHKITSQPAQPDTKEATAKFEIRSRETNSTKKMKHSTGTDESWKTSPNLIIRKRSPEGHQITFAPKFIDRNGRVHHGAYVKGAPKSSECRRHKKDPAPATCSFAHSWKGDHTRQTVCQLCTERNARQCDKSEHERSIFDLGHYLNEKGETWKPQRDPVECEQQKA